MSKPLICILGRSGSGKNYIANKLIRKGYTSAKSFTTRPMRPNDENDINAHTFITPDRVSDYKDNIVADTYFNGAYYFATRQQLNCADIYILDEEGLNQVRNNYTERDILSFYIECDSSICAERMSKRGDADRDIMKRLQHDSEAFANTKYICKFICPNETQEDANDIVDFIDKLFQYYNSRSSNND